ncbi:ATP synthase F1 subunit epsilon [Acidocella aromatica]|uniref:ATP synthase epsilon chain n=1 Tax=Acidocella aromatica TaxID=1303579 RepID=A0A840VNG6_9PROT|nr:ATP synthase F1 subunit epsilon [Acidocella aromatica]MBB5372980.1 F-type H+-transporting ATPase subunit epsilon [Acidocella aromatica]
MPIALEIISPEKLLLARDVDMVVIPGTEGDIGVLPGHSMLITGLRGGLVDIYEKDQVTDRFFVSGGFAEITESRIAVLADEIVRQADLDPAKAADALAKAKAAYEAADLNNADAYREVSDQLISAQAMVDSIAPGKAE